LHSSHLIRKSKMKYSTCNNHKRNYTKRKNCISYYNTVLNVNNIIQIGRYKHVESGSHDESNDFVMEPI
jgi:hypothetical protein